MHVKKRSPQGAVVRLNRTELKIMGKCLDEAANGLTADRFTAATAGVSALSAGITDALDRLAVVTREAQGT